jgi:hypothetical protein
MPNKRLGIVVVRELCSQIAKYAPFSQS